MVDDATFERLQDAADWVLPDWSVLTPVPQDPPPAAAFEKCEQWLQAYPSADLTPESLPAAPSDPFTGGPLQCRRLERGFRLHSVGPDGHDDGGLERPLDAKQRDAGNHDLIFAIER